jgi:putative endonuclease
LRGSCSGSPEPVAPHLQLGREGERLAAQFLRRQGCKVLYRNFRAPHGGEVDIVCRDGDTLVFTEVKTRSSDYFGAPAEAVNDAKQRLISRGALAWLRMLDHPDILFRFDIIEVAFADGVPTLNRITNAFSLSEPYLY